MGWWSDFLYLLTNNVYFRSGFMWGLAIALVVWILWALGYRLYVQWLKMRQFFEPIKKPGRVPVESGPSPANIMFGCVWRLVITLVVLAIVIAITFWLVNGLWS